MLQELSLKKLLSKCFATRVAQSSSESSRGNNPKTTVQEEKAAYEAQASGMQGGCRALSPQCNTPPPHHSLGGGMCKWEEGPGNKDGDLG